MRFRFKISLAVKQASRLLALPHPSLGELRMSEGNLVSALADPGLSAEERAALYAMLESIRAAIQQFGGDHPEDGMDGPPIL